MNRSEREKLEAEREARRARRLSERAQQRARRQAEQADLAAQRAEDLARRANRRSPRHRDMDRSIEDVVDDVAHKWSQKAEAWMDEQSRKMFSDDSDYGMGSDKSGFDDESYDDVFGLGDDDMHDEMHDDMYDDGSDSKRQRQARELEKERIARRKQRARRRQARIKSETNGRHTRRWTRRNRNGNLYRNSQNKKICGVCSGIADYWGMETWQVRMMAVIALFIVPSVAVPGYFIAYFLMDEKPYYRRVTDRFHELDEGMMEEEPMTKGAGQTRKKFSKKQAAKNAREPKVSNIQALRSAKQKFSDIEDRLRVMETHVTSPKFELQRELRKIAGDEL